MIKHQELFKFLSDETRLRCILLLQREKELCVCELSHTIGMIQPKISRHLALLRQSGLVSDERRGQWVYYRFGEKLQPTWKKIIISIVEELKEIEPYRSDYQNLLKIRMTKPCDQ